MIRKEQCYDEFEHAQSVWRAMAGADHHGDKFDSEKFRLKMNFLKDLYIRLTDESDDSVLRNLNEYFDVMRQEWKKYWDRETSIAFKAYRGKEDDQEGRTKYLASLGIVEGEGIEGIIRDIRSIIGEVT